MSGTVIIKYTLLGLLILALSGCGERGMYALGYQSYYYKPTLQYEQIGGEWEIFTPPEGKWLWERQSVTYLPDNFSVESLKKYDYRKAENFFYARYSLAEGTCLALWIRPSTAFIVKKSSIPPYIKGLDSGHEKIGDNSDYCLKYNQQFIGISAATANVNFDNSETYFIKNGKKIPGIEVDFSIKAKVRGLIDTESLPHVIYNLGAAQTLADKQPYFRDDLDHLTFYFRFPMTCADLEDAVLVIDGFSHNGKPLPPLKVRLNYYDFSAVPK